MRRFSRGLLVAAVSAGAVGASGSTAIASARPAPPPPGIAKTCPAGALGVRTLGSEGAAGSVYVTVGLTNLGKRPCVLRGHPGVAFVGRHGRQIGVPATWSGGAGKPVTLPAGGRATFVVRYVQAGIQEGCEQPASIATASGLRIYPPGSPRAKYLPLPGVRACVNPAVHQLSVGPVTH